ncbi:hypothetical protein JAAARDRAFT_81129 [Jaapia argillacea MUCL 33604]|uniref:Phytocyanin domain-containing protein n=1 Tax=Jaapia argillacea MUCL 33604 TaxID=933084 RepID=A0A067PF66_9AGAM|nr:hypothetical protein JAAARDRAFT_81129 [Jaapia argillacea MUCL 33604]
MPRLLRLSLLSAQVLIVLGQTTHTVMVGTSLHFYDPPTLSAQTNDTITFIIGAGLHGVTQTTFETPCYAMPGGFNSGLVGPGTNLSAPAMKWDLVLTNGSTPIWYFCQGTRPESHCAVGMVGVINPPSNDMWSTYIAAAKSISGTPAPNTSPTLQGSGAYAIQTPTPVVITASPTSDATAISALSSFFIPPTSSATHSPSPSPSPSQSSSKKVATGPIVGGVIGGVVVLAIIGTLAYFLWRASRQSNPSSATNQVPVDPRQIEENKSYVGSEAVLIPNRNNSTNSGQASPRSATHDGESVYSAGHSSLHYTPSLSHMSGPPSPQWVPVQNPQSFVPRPMAYGQPGPAMGVAYPNVREIATEILQMLRQEGVVPGPPVNPVGGGAPQHTNPAAARGGNPGAGGSTSGHANLGVGSSGNIGGLGASG